MKAPDNFNASLQRSIAERLRALQKVAGATDQQMADYVGIGRTAWANAISINGKNPNKPPEEAMLVLCEKTGLTMDWIYRGKLDGTPYALGTVLFEELSRPDECHRGKVVLPGLSASDQD